jgi:hypothetical protein
MREGVLSARAAAAASTFAVGTTFPARNCRSVRPLRDAAEVEHVRRAVPCSSLAHGARIEQVDDAALHARIERLNGRSLPDECPTVAPRASSASTRVRPDESGRAGDDGDHVRVAREGRIRSKVMCGDRGRQRTISSYRDALCGRR